jgi:hypothetical protein
MDELKEIWISAIEYWRPKMRPTDAHYTLWHEDLTEYAVVDVRTAYKIMKRTYKEFPSIANWVAFADSCAFNRREEEHRKSMDQERKEARAFWSSDVAKDSTGKQALANIKAMLSGRITLREYLTAARDLGISVKELEHFYESHGCNLDKPTGAKASGGREARTARAGGDA